MNGASVFLTPSGTDALEMAALLLDIRPGDEVIMPSFTFVSTANAFVLRGGVPVFVDIRPDTMNINEKLIEAAITPRTRAIVPVHYAGIGCEMDAIMAIARKHRLAVVEDAAHALLASYKSKPLGSIADISIFSFHEMKNYTSGEGGAVVVNNPAYTERAEIIRCRGTDRTRFLLGMVDKYSWTGIGSYFGLSELNAAYLWANLEQVDVINQRRLDTWQAYYRALEPLQKPGRLELPYVPAHCTHNGHIFYIKLRDRGERDEYIRQMKDRGISCVFHYVPLHSSPAGQKYGRFHGEDRFTTQESERLVRLPMYEGLKKEEVTEIVGLVFRFLSGMPASNSEKTALARQ